MRYSVRFLLVLVCFGSAVFTLYSQELMTADRFLESVSQRYAEIVDYEARIVIRSGGRDMVGNLSYREPNLLRIDFTDPAEQVLVFNGDFLTVHIPGLRATLVQAVVPLRRAGNPAAGVGMASAHGLQLLRQGYVASFLVGPDPVPLESGSQEMVVKLRLTRRLASEGFREIILSVNPETRLIRRIEARTIAEALVRFDFLNVRTNVGIPEQRFIYDAPPTANVFHNFMFRDIE